MQDVLEFLGDLSTLSTTGLIGSVFAFLETSGSWADSLSKILGLAG